ncbi:MAG: hypothetical protein WB383_03890 [Acidimicrobiales bacterium]
MSAPARKLHLGLVIAATVIGFAHPADLIGGGVFLGAGYAGAAVIRRSHDRDEQTLDVATWIETRSFPSDTAAEIVEQLRDRSLAELRSSVAERSFFDGMAAERDLQRARRSRAAKRGVSRRVVRCATR